MSKNLEQKMPASVLRAIYLFIEEQMQTNVNPVLEVADVLNRSKESVYRRFRGDSAFTLNDLWLLHQNYAIPFDAIFDQHSSNTISLNILDFTADEVDKDMQSAMHAFALDARNPCYLFTNAIPLMHVQQRPILLLIKQKLWQNLYNINNPEVIPLHATESQHVHEVWTDNVTFMLVQELDFVLACGIEFSTTDLYAWYIELAELLRARIFTDSTKSILYQSEVSFPTSLLISLDADAHMHVLFSDLLVGTSRKLFYAKPVQQWATHVLQQGIMITGQSVRLKRLFFARLMKPIMASAHKRLNEEQFQRLSQLVK